MKMPPQMVIFDCDGVIVDSEKITIRVIRDNLVGYGLDLPLDRINALFVGGTMAGAMEQARALGATLPEAWLDEIYGQMFEELGRAVEPVAGIVEVLDRLEYAGIPYAIGSNGPHAKMDVTLGRTGLKDRFGSRIYSREDVSNPKPAPDVYLKAARDAGIAPAHCVVIDDSISGVTAGVAAGMLTLGYAADIEPARLNAHCDLVFETMADLPGLLGLG